MSGEEYEIEHEAEQQDIEVPDWLIALCGDNDRLERMFEGLSEEPSKRRDAAINEVQEIAHHGCASGAFMPACEYWTAHQVMAGESGGSAFDFLEEFQSDMGEPMDALRIKEGDSWRGFLSRLLCVAVELWCQRALSSLEVD